MHASFGVLPKSAAACLIAVLVLSGCKSRQDGTVETAKEAAAATGQAQQVVSVDKHGTRTTTTVQPPVPGQAGQAVTTTVTPGVGPVASSTTAPVTGQGSVAGPGAQPLAGGNPVIRPADLTIPSGTSLMVRINQHISVKSSRVGDRFDGEIVEPVVDGSGREVVAKGTSVLGVVDASHRRGHFRGASVLELRLVSMTLNGRQYRLDTRDLTRGKKGKGRRSTALIGGGTGLGMLIGGVATGGVGLLVGGLAGAGAGTAAAGLTGNRDLEIPAESIVRFKLAEDLVVQL